MSKTLFVTGSDQNLFYLAKGLILSLEEARSEHHAKLAYLDLGCEQPQLEWVTRHVDILCKPKDDLGVSDLSGFKNYMLAQTCRPFLREYFPDFDIYLWIDADTWVQKPETLGLYLAAARKGRIAITPEVSSSYRSLFSQARLNFFYRANAWVTSYNAAAAEAYAFMPYINSGVFALPEKCPLWDAFAENLRMALKNGINHLSEQLALQKTILETNLGEFLPPYCNWMCNHAYPAYDATRQCYVEPALPHTPIGILHLAENKLRPKYVEKGMLYRQGRYLTSEEVPRHLQLPELRTAEQ